MTSNEERMNFLFDYSSIADYNYKAKEKYKPAFTYSGNYSALCESGPTVECHQETLLSKCLRLMISSFCYAILICTFPISFPLCIRKVPALERIVIFRLGKIEKVKGPGFIFIMPCIDHWIKVDLHAQVFKAPTQQMLTRDGAILEVSALVHYQIVDVVRSVMQVEGVEHVFKQLVQQCITTAVTQRDEEDVTRNTHILQKDLQTMLNKSTVAWGLEVTQVDIPPVQILKAGESRDPVSTLMTALNTAMGGKPDLFASSNMGSTDTTGVMSGGTESMEHVGNVDHAFSLLSKMVQTVMGQPSFQGQDGVIRLEITDEKRIFYLVIKNGAGDLYEDLVGTAQNTADVTLSLTSQVLMQMLTKRLNPLRAYSRGLVSVEGNWSLLKNFTQLTASSP